MPRWWFVKRGALVCVALACVAFFNVYVTNSLSQEQTVIRNKYCKFPRVKCSVDGGRSHSCYKDSDDVYFPFSLIKKQFDVSGRYTKDNNSFEWITSYAKVRTPDGESYDSAGPFGHFGTYNVENRERVRCINGDTGVPMSTQWNPVPYYYPIQVSQYGLQHYSRLKSGNFTSVTVVVGAVSKEWKGSAGEGDTSERIFYEDEVFGHVMNVTSPAELVNPGCYIYLNPNPELHIIHLELMPVKNTSFTVLVQVMTSNELVLLHYVYGEVNPYCVRMLPNSSNSGSDPVSFVYAMGKETAAWKSITRDILVDTSRALSSISNSQRKKEANVILRPGDIRLITLGFRGTITLKPKILQKNEAHLEFFLTAANWMITHQTERGGWRVPVERFIADRRLSLPSGWHSAMAQGHGISLLVRAFHHTNDAKYLIAAIDGLRLFEQMASDGGVVNYFMGNVWYEEYPTTPGSFVLNGFMYSLIGLYDLSSLKEFGNSNTTDGFRKAERLFKQGVESLRVLLPLFDTGSGSIYDLRHVGLKTTPNLARWDYHAVHVYLLKWLVIITGDKQFDDTANRWVDYSYGKRAKHN